MPLHQDNMHRFVQNRESGGAHGNLMKQAQTPQPNQQRERSQQRHDEDKSRPRATSGDRIGINSDETSRQHASKMKLPVHNTLGNLKADIAKSTKTNLTEVATSVVQNKPSRTVANVQPARQVSSLKLSLLVGRANI